MCRLAVGLLVSVTVALQPAAASEVMILVSDPDGAAGRVAAPVSLRLDLHALRKGTVPFSLRENWDSPHVVSRLILVELDETGQSYGRPIPVQFEPESPGSLIGTLWWLMPPGAEGKHRFRLSVADQQASAARRGRPETTSHFRKETVPFSLRENRDSPPVDSGQLLSARYDARRELVDVSEGSRPVLRYNHGTVPPPPHIVEHFEQGAEQPLYYARGDYIHPLHGPDGEELTDDYSLNHPHHRGVNWSWPVVRWKGEARDLWAVRVLPSQAGGIWARPVTMRRVLAGPVMAVIEAENVWKWGDQDPIVREEVLIRAFRSTERCRFVEVEVRLTAIVDDVSIGGRPGVGYGGFAMRSFPEFPNRRITMHVDPPRSKPRRAWFHLTGNFPGGKGPAGVALLEHVGNPGYPNYPNPDGIEGIPGQYPPWRCVLPCFPGDKEVPLPEGGTLTLKHRLWIHPGKAGRSTLDDVWGSYAEPPKTAVAK